MARYLDPIADLSFEGEVLHWRGPAPWFFLPLPPDAAETVRGLARAASYGWGVIPVTAAVGEVVFTTSLFPRDETYLLPLKTEVRRRAGVTAGDRVAVEMQVMAAR